ncbi:MAG: DEAD/DEAH box helicase family protein, partial [Selenomonadaceae bacterium]|nr:DEAD/DEAH box helicase family protein [Selenomonadaceae bacterium]
DENISERDKGTRFEVLMKNFLLTYAPYRGKFSEVWLWKDFPHKNIFGGKDLGIDIVAKTFDGNFWAVQCKFYAESATIDKPAVDSFFANATREIDGKKFSAFVWISTTDNYTDNAREMFKGRAEEIHIIGIEELRKAAVDWQKLDAGIFGKNAVLPRELRDYQIEAIQKADEHFQKFNRGQLIMACGTGKTFTALKIAEKIFPTGKILFLVPSISLLSQTLEEWATYSEKPLNAVCVCSDATAADKSKYDVFEVNLPLPAITDENKIADAVKNFSNDNMTVIFSTYQSLEKVIAAQKIFDAAFDLIICDEAHRTTGFSDKDDKAFTKVHDNKNIRGNKRLYMTATPRFYKTDTKDTDDEKKLTVWSMNDAEIFGEEFFRISFAQAVSGGWLSDYKVFVYTVNELFLTKKLREAINDKNSPLTMDETLKLIGAIIALSKHMDKNSLNLIKDDPNKFMHSAVSFCQKIDHAEYVSDNFSAVQEKFLADMSDDDKKSFVQIQSDFVFGSRKVGKKTFSMPASKRDEKLQRLRNISRDENFCYVLNNARCLSEGVDVPALDAIIFLSTRKSKVEIIQAVGRVMRKAKGKQFGYVIIPVIVPLDKSPEIFLAESKDFSVVYDVLNALRAHDDAMDVE